MRRIVRASIDTARLTVQFTAEVASRRFGLDDGNLPSKINIEAFFAG